MKAISIKQPWCSLIAHGIKDIENRTWPCPKAYIGQRFLIHASSTSWTWHRVVNYLTLPMRDAFLKLGYNGDWLRGLPTGAIIGSVEIVDCVINHPSIWAEKTNKPVSQNKVTYNWVLANPVLYAKPIENVKGKLSFWDYPDELPFDDILEANKDVLKRIKEKGD